MPVGHGAQRRDDVNKVGHLFGGTIDDAFGTGGWGLTRPGRGRRRHRRTGIGLNGFGGLGHTGPAASAANCGGIGIGYGKPRRRLHARRRASAARGRPGDDATGTCRPRSSSASCARTSAAIAFCYQNGLKANPTLEGRVTVKFVIGRDGAVQLAADGGSDIPDAGVRQCVVSSLHRAVVPRARQRHRHRRLPADVHARSDSGASTNALDEPVVDTS